MYKRQSVRRELHPLGAGAGVRGRPVHPHPAHVQGSGRAEEAVQAAVVAAERAGDGQVVAGLVQREGQHRVGAHLDEDAVARLDERGRDRSEQDGRAQVAVPVGGAECAAVDVLTGDRGVQRDLALGRRQAGERGGEPFLQLLDHPGVRGVAHGHRAGAPAALLAAGPQPRERRQRTAHHGLAGTVEHGHGQLVAEQGPHVGHGDGDREHAADAGQLAQHPGAPGHHRGAVGEGEDAGRAGRRDLALAVPDDRGRAHAVGAPQLDERDHDGPQRGLHHVVAAHGLGVGEHVAQRPVDVRRERLGAALHRLGEDRLGVPQPHAHADPLRALAGEDEDGLARVVGHAAHGRGEVVAQQHGAVREVRARGGQREPHVGPVRAGGEQRAQPVGLTVQCLGGARGEQQGDRGRPPGGRLRGRCLDGGRLGEDDVAVGAAHAERADAGHQRRRRVRPPVRGGLHAQTQPVEVDARVGGAEVQAGRDAAVPDREHGLEQAHDAAGAFQVADVRLDRADHQGITGRAARREDLAQCGGLDRVAHRGSTAVQLDVLHLGGVHFGRRVRGAQHRGLGGAARRGERVGGPVVVDRAASDHRVHVIAVGEGPVQRLEQHDRAALAAHVAVGRLVEGGAAAAG